MPVPGQGVLGTIGGGQTLLGLSTDTGQTPGANITPGTGGTVSSTGQILPSGPFRWSTGWYVVFGVTAGIFLSNTRIAPLALGILTVGLLYQINLLIQGK